METPRPFVHLWSKRKKEGNFYVPGENGLTARYINLHWSLELFARGAIKQRMADGCFAIMNDYYVTGMTKGPSGEANPISPQDPAANRTGKAHKKKTAVPKSKIKEEKTRQSVGKEPAFSELTSNPPLRLWLLLARHVG